MGSVCVLGSSKGGGIQAGSYLFVLPSRRVREQIKGFSLGGWEWGWRRLHRLQPFT